MTCRQHRDLPPAHNPEAPLEGLHDHWQEQPAPRLKWWWWLLVGLICGLAYVLLLESARAHDHAHPELDSWFLSLTNSNGIPCCDVSEATRLEDVDWDSKCDENNKCHYRVHVEGRWWDVPDNAVVRTPNRLGPTMIWPVWHGDGENPHKDMVIRCFIVGAGT